MKLKKVGKFDDLFKEKLKHSKECKVEYVDNVNTKMEVRTTTFTPSKMKQKEELRKMTEKYIDR